MLTKTLKNKHRLFTRFLSLIIAWTMVITSITPVPYAFAQGALGLNLPAPGTFVSTTSGFTPVIVRGLTIHPENPLEFDFIVDTGHTNLDEAAFTNEASRLIKYFLASLTVPEKEMWVNLSPYEKDRIIPESFGVTEMGIDLLSQDYMLKQLTASLMYPENELGKKFWKRIAKLAQDRYGMDELPVNVFNKVWIVPDKAAVYEHNGSVFVVERHLKVLLEEDYLALANSEQRIADSRAQQSADSSLNAIRYTPNAEIIREIIIPEIEREVNEGETFAKLRQIYNSMILATWYKKHLRQSLLGQVYVDQNKVKGIDVKDKQSKEKVYAQYIEAFKKGVYNYIKEEYDVNAQKVIPRKYFSGGAVGLDPATLVEYRGAPEALSNEIKDAAAMTVGESRLVKWQAVEDPDAAAISQSKTKGEGVDTSERLDAASLATPEMYASEEELKIDPEKDALLIIDAQPTFMPGGGLAVNEGDQIIPEIRKLMNIKKLQKIYATKDWHPRGHNSLVSSYVGLAPMTLLVANQEIADAIKQENPEAVIEVVSNWTEENNPIAPYWDGKGQELEGPFAQFTLNELKEYIGEIGVQVLWPDHGIEGTQEAELHPDLSEQEFTYVLKKGTDPKVDSYSGFLDNRKVSTGLAERLREDGVERLFVAGLACDYCVGWSAENARDEGFEVILVESATRSVGFPADSVPKIYQTFKDKGVRLVKTADEVVQANTFDRAALIQLVEKNMNEIVQGIAPNGIARAFRAGQDLVMGDSQVIEREMKEAREHLYRATSNPNIIRQAEEAFEILLNNPHTEDMMIEEFKGVVHRLIKELTGNHDAYKEYKETLNREINSVYQHVSDTLSGMTTSEEKLRLAIIYSGIANYFDLGNPQGLKSAAEMLQVEEDNYVGLFSAAYDQVIEGKIIIDELDKFFSDLEENKGGSIMYFLDNHGEVMLDQIVIEELLNEGYKVNVVGRAETVRDDVTVNEAHDILSANPSLGEYFESGKLNVITDGSFTLGVDLRQSQKHPGFVKAWEDSFTFISKGVGNFNSLFGTELSRPGLFIRMMKGGLKGYGILEEAYNTTINNRSALDMTLAYQEEDLVLKHKVLPTIPKLTLRSPSLDAAYEAFKAGKHLQERTAFDVVAPVAPQGASYMVAAGAELVFNDINQREFSDFVIEGLRRLGRYDEDFFQYLKGFNFEGDFHAVKEGEIVSPGMPLMRFKANDVERFLIQDIVKNRLQYSTNIATKWARIAQAGNGEFVNEEEIEMLEETFGVTRDEIQAVKPSSDQGLRRSQGKSAHVAARSARIGGASSTSTVKGAMMYNIVPKGTMAHLFIMTFDPEHEIEAFRLYAKAFPNDSIFLTDAYETINGTRKAIVVGQEMKEKGNTLLGVRPDSGDIAKYSRKMTRMLQKAGLDKSGAFVADNLDEFKITEDMLLKGALVKGWGVGTQGVTGGKYPTLELDIIPSNNGKVFKILNKDGVVDRFIEVPLGVKPKISNEERMEEILFPFWNKGRRVAPFEDTDALNGRTNRNVKSLSVETKKLVDGFVIPYVKRDDLDRNQVVLEDDIFSDQEPVVTYEHPVLDREEDNIAFSVDMYHLTMGQSFWMAGKHNVQSKFNYFFRTPPYSDTRLIFAGLRAMVEELKHFKFSKENIEKLRGLGVFDEKYLDFLENFEFKGKIESLGEGDLLFSQEPGVIVTGTIFEAALVESFLSNKFNFSTLQASWAAEVRKDKGENEVLIEDGMETAHADSHLEASYASYIGGVDYTTNLDAHLNYGIPLAEPNQEGEYLRGDFITGGPKAALGGVYKLAVFNGNDRVKIANIAIKTSRPGSQDILEVTEDGEVVDRINSLKIEEIKLTADQKAKTKTKNVTKEGKISYEPPKAQKIKAHAKNERYRYRNIEDSRISEGLDRRRAELVEKAISADANSYAEFVSNLDDQHIVDLLNASRPNGIPERNVAKPVAYTSSEIIRDSWSEENIDGLAHPYVDEPKISQEERQKRLKYVRQEIMEYAPDTEFGEDGLPKNSYETGLTGRGPFRFYGKNKTADGVLLRIAENGEDIEVLVNTRTDGGGRALPGTFMQSFENENPGLTASRGLKEKAGIDIDFTHENVVEIFKGDGLSFRATNNAWPTYEGLALLISYEDSLKLNLKSGSSAAKDSVRFESIQPPSQYFGVHGMMIGKAVAKVKAGEIKVTPLNELQKNTSERLDAASLATPEMYASEEELKIDPEKDALLIIDAQPTFMPGGGLAVTDGDQIIPEIQKLMSVINNIYGTRDKHPKGHNSVEGSYVGLNPMTLLVATEQIRDAIKEENPSAVIEVVGHWTEEDNPIAPYWDGEGQEPEGAYARFTLGELKEYINEIKVQVLWTNHGIDGTEEAELHPDLNAESFKYILDKGTDPRVDSYSGFLDNLKRSTGLAERLREDGVERLFVAGLACDYCVGWSAENARDEGFEVILVESATKSVGFPADSVPKIYQTFKDKDVRLVKTADEVVAVQQKTEILVHKEAILSKPKKEETESGRGVLYYEGENEAADAIVMFKNEKGEVMVLVGDKKDGVVLPGGFIDKSEKGKTGVTQTRELREETSAEIDMTTGTVVFDGKVEGDKRNTKDAWITSVAVAKLISQEKALTLKLNSIPNPDKNDLQNARFEVVNQKLFDSLAVEAHGLMIANAFEKITSGEIKVDSAAIQSVGGINLDAAFLNLQIKRDGSGVPLPVNQQPIGNMNIKGFTPFIIHVVPVNVPMYLGFLDHNDLPTHAQDRDDDRLNDQKVYYTREAADELSLLN